MTKTPPNDKTAEQAVLGSMLIPPASGAVAVARELLTPEDFYQEAYRVAFRAILAVADRREVPDAVTVGAELARSGAEGISRADLVECSSVVVSAAHVEHYARVVRRASLERQIISASSRLSVDQCPENLTALSELVRQKEMLGAPPLLVYSRDISSDIVDSLAGPTPPRLHQTGIHGLDTACLGFAPGELLTVAGSTNIGKSLFLLGMMHSTAAKGTRCLFVGSEMTARETFLRHLSVESGVEAWRIRKGRLDASHTAALAGSMGRMHEMPVSILDLPEPSLQDIEAALVASRAEVVFVDYLTRCRLPREESLRLRIKAFMVSLKSLARRRGVFVVLAAQLSRAVYGREENAPTLADLSESSSIEQESDAVVLLWAPKAKQPGTGRVLEANVAKNRHGERGLAVDLSLDDETLRITELQANVLEPEEA